MNDQNFKVPHFYQDWEGRIHINEEKAQEVQWLYEEVASGWPLSEIAGELNKRAKIYSRFSSSGGQEEAK